MDMEVDHCNQITQVSLKTLAFPLPRLKVLIIKMLSPQSYCKGNLQRFYTVQKNDHKNLVLFQLRGPGSQGSFKLSTIG
jgi:hypothetical protein